MIKCPECGYAENPDAHTFCSHCGADLPEPPEATIPPTDPLRMVKDREVPEVAAGELISVEPEEAVHVEEGEVIEAEAGDGIGVEPGAGTKSVGQMGIIVLVVILLVVLFCACCCCSSTMFFWSTGTAPTATPGPIS